MKTRPLINSDRRYKTPEQQNTPSEPLPLHLGPYATHYFSLFLAADSPFSPSYVFRYEPCAKLSPSHSLPLVPSPPLLSLSNGLPPERQGERKRIYPPFPPPCTWAARTPPSVAYKSRVFNYPASTGRITNAHAMENIPRRLPSHARTTAQRTWARAGAGAWTCARANTRHAFNPFYDIVRPKS